MAGAMSEIIHCVDSEITALPAVVKKNGSPKGCGIPSLLTEAAISPARQSRFHPARAGFHSARKGRISLLLSESDSARYAREKNALAGMEKSRRERGKPLSRRRCSLRSCERKLRFRESFRVKVDTRKGTEFPRTLAGASEVTSAPFAGGGHPGWARDPRSCGRGCWGQHCPLWRGFRGGRRLRWRGS